MRPSFPSQIRQRVTAPSRRCWGLLCMYASSPLCVGSGAAYLVFAVAFCAQVKNRFRVVVACHVPRCVGTARAEPHSHVPPPNVKRQTSAPPRTLYRDRTDKRFGLALLLRLCSICLTRIVDISSPPTGRPPTCSQTMNSGAFVSIVRG
jgi:hypothetical protein